MSELTIKLVFNIRSEWHIGSGEEGGAYADALTLKDARQLPYIPGRSVRGLLREAFQTGVDNGWLENDFFSLLFGQSGEQISTQGLLRITNATLSDQEIAYLTSETNKDAYQHLYRVHYSTAIDETTGVAKEGSLRGMEVAVPMTLTASLNLNHNHPNANEIDSEHIVRILNDITPLITNIGAKRHRGYGQAYVNVVATQGAN